MNVYQNIAYALKSRKISEEIDKKVKEIIDIVELNEHIYKSQST